MTKPGDVVFFKKARESSKRKCNELTYKGYGFGVFLGHVPPFAPDPPKTLLLRIMGQAGFISFDDVEAFVGKEIAEKINDLFTDKYYGKVRVDLAGPGGDRTVKTIVDGNGKPVGLLPTIEGGPYPLVKEPQ